MSNTRVPLSVLYLTTEDSGVEGFIELAAKAQLANVTVCTSWDQLLAGVARCLGNALVIFDTWYLTSETISPEEITGMLCAVYKCTNHDSDARQHRIRFALYSDTKCQSLEVKSLKSSEILGIIPGSAHATLERRVEIVNTIASLKSCWPREIMHGPVRRIENEISGIHLTTRQTQVLSLVCNRGLSNKKIASVLKISESTVKVHISAILKEYGVRNRTQLALAARENLHS